MERMRVAEDKKEEKERKPFLTLSFYTPTKNRLAPDSLSPT